MVNDMTVEGMIELLKEKYPQAIILIEEPFRYEGTPRVLAPIRLLSVPQTGCVHIICKEHFRKRG